MSGTSVTSGAVERTTSVWRRARARKLPPTEIRNPEGLSNPTRVGNRVKDHRRRASGRNVERASAWPWTPPTSLTYFYSLFARRPSDLGPPLRSVRRGRVPRCAGVIAHSPGYLLRMRPAELGRAEISSRVASRRVALRHVSDFATSRGGLGRTSSSSSSVSRAGNEWRRARERAVRYPALNWLLCLVNRNS